MLLLRLLLLLLMLLLLLLMLQLVLLPGKLPSQCPLFYGDAVLAIVRRACVARRYHKSLGRRPGCAGRLWGIGCGLGWG